jgi:Tol biopolymer transport system component
MTYRLGVDLGTTFTAAATANGMPPTMVGLGNRSLQIPSVLFLTEQQEILVGESAERRGLGQPDRIVREFNRRIGDTVPILVAGAPFSPEALAAHLLQHVVQTTIDRVGERPGEVVLTHPANWGPYKLELLDQVARLAGVERSSRCPEPLAAAAQYAAQTRVAVGETIAVYDLGGGTFDACVLRKTTTGFVQLGTPEGIEHLGGIDFDEALFRHALGMLGDRAVDLDPDDPDVTEGLARLRRDCVDAKEALSADTDAMLPVALPGVHTTLRLTRSEFESLIRPALADSVAALDRAIQAAGLSPDQLSAIVLVGGSSRIPLIGELLHQAFPTPTAMDTHPKHDIALGAVQLDQDHLAAPPADSPTVRSLRAAPVAQSMPSAPPPPQSMTVPQPPPSGPGTSGPGTSGPGTSGPEATGRGPAAAGLSTSTTSEQPGQPGGRRRMVLIGACAAAVVAGIVIGVAVVINRDKSDGFEAGPSIPFESFAPSTSPTTAPSSPSASAGREEPAGIPVSAKPLGKEQLYVSMQTAPGQWDLYLADTTRSSPGKPVTRGTGFNLGPLPSPTSRSVTYAHVASGQSKPSLRVAGAADFSGDRVLFSLPTGCGKAARAAWSPTDLDLLALACTDSDGEHSIHLVHTDGRPIRSITPPPGMGRVDDPAFTADGSRIGYWAAPDNGADGGVLYTEPVLGGEASRLLDDADPAVPGQDADLVFSPDGRYVAFRRWVPTSDGKGQQDIYRARSDGTEVHPLTTDSANERDPSWSPDSQRLAYKSNRIAKPYKTADRVWIMNLDGKDQHLLWSKNVPNPQGAPGWTAR